MFFLYAIVVFDIIMYMVSVLAVSAVNCRF